MKRTITVFCALVLGLGLLTQPTSASIFTAGLTYDGVPDVIQDNSVSTLVFDTGPLGVADGIQNAGDVIAGVIKWNQNNTPPYANFGETTMAFFAIEVLTGPVASVQTIGPYSGLSFTLGPVNPLNGAFTMAGLLPNQSAATGGGFNAQTMVAVFSDPGGQNLTSVAPWTAWSNAAGMLDDTTSWGLDLTMGLVASTDFFQAIVADTNGDGQITYATEFLGLLDGDQTGREAAGFTAIINNVGTLLPVAFTDLYGVASSADIALLSSTQLVQGTPEQQAMGWAFADQSLVKLNPVPEPVSLLIWSLLAAAGLGMTFWRRRR